MRSIGSELSRLLGAANVSRAPGRLKAYARDFAGHDLGEALAAVTPARHEQVVELVRWARRSKIALTPVGARTSFWASTRVRGRVAVDLSRMSRLLEFDAEERTVRAQAGMTVAALDRELRPRGCYLPTCPDGYGNAVLASLVANDTTAGHGMFVGAASDLLVGVTAVLGTGETLRTGASSVLAGLPPFSRGGLPDLTGPLLASEGALGIVTELALRVLPLPRLETLELAPEPSPEGFRRLLAVVQKLRAGTLCHAWRHESWVTGRPDSLRIQIAGYGSSEELDAKRRHLLGLLREAGLPEPVALPRNPPTWQEPPPRPEGWKGVSVAAPYARIAAIYELWRSRLRAEVAAVASPEGFLRVYLGSGGTAALVGWNHPQDADSQAASLSVEARVRSALAPLGIPYRVGTVWQTLLAGRVDPTYRRCLGLLKALFDPDGILNPGVGLFHPPGGATINSRGRQSRPSATRIRP